MFRFRIVPPSVVMTTSALAEPTPRLVRLDAPFTDQKPGTSGLRKSSRQFEEPHYLESFIEASLRTLPGVQGGTLVAVSYTHLTLPTKA